ncbi:MAG: hypothetical protein IH905_04165 [Proteobacteria bacterium]|nr:hypothetical protein [Pseudomonadota bacterium]
MAVFRVAVLRAAALRLANLRGLAVLAVFVVREVRFDAFEPVSVALRAITRISSLDAVYDAAI